MLRRLTRPGAALGAVLASLAFAAGAHAAPTTPQLNSVPYNVCGASLNISWSASSPDRGAQLIAYRVDVGDLSAGTASYKWSLGLGTQLTGLISGHHYVVRVRALELTSANAFVYSASSADTFMRRCLQISPEILKRYVAYNPFPECIMCGITEIYRGDDVIQRAIRTASPPAAERIAGVQLNAGGGATIVTG